MDLAAVEKAINLFRKERITVHGFFIIGLPSESKNDIDDTIECAIRVNPHFANFSRYFPILGTPIYNQLIDNDNLSDEGENSFFSWNSSIKYDMLSNEEVNAAFRQAWKIQF